MSEFVSEFDGVWGEFVEEAGFREYVVVCSWLDDFVRCPERVSHFVCEEGLGGGLVKGLRDVEEYSDRLAMVASLEMYCGKLVSVPECFDYCADAFRSTLCLAGEEFGVECSEVPVFETAGDFVGYVDDFFGLVEVSRDNGVVLGEKLKGVVSGFVEGFRDYAVESENFTALSTLKDRLRDSLDHNYFEY